jgi:amino-acid N-acetyltransferase
VRPAQSLNIRHQQIAELSGSSESQDRLAHRAKEKLLDRVGDGRLLF